MKRKCESPKYLAIDIGASSGRHLIGYRSTNNEWKLEEVYRFNNWANFKNDELIWDINHLVKKVIKGIKKAVELYPDLISVSIDTFGVDYVLLSKGFLIAPCRCYRDYRNTIFQRLVDCKYGFSNIYSRNGIQSQPFNTLYQLTKDLTSGLLNKADCFMLLPEYLSYVLTGVDKKELTDCSTMALLRSGGDDFDYSLIKALSLPEYLFTKPSKPGETLGFLKDDIASYVGKKLKVVLCHSHDTASAVYGMGVERNIPYVSSGTWSLLGMRLAKPVINKNSLQGNWTNESDIEGIRLQKNIMGMWLIQALRKEICPDKSYMDIVKWAEESKCMIEFDVSSQEFLSPSSMVALFERKLKEQGLEHITPGDMFRSAYLSLATCYKQALEELSQLTQTRLTKLVIFGGGAKNFFLNDLIEQKCRIKVEAYPIEATSLGNIKDQEVNYYESHI